ncbi:MAG: hypothetical protein SH868_19095 [Bythopirellula sp.]|nr:hypothetical protein [Bythopirellula sp.]
MKRKRLLALVASAMLSVAIICPPLHAAFYSFRYSTVFDAHATDHDIFVDGMRRYDEVGWGTTYWGPSAANAVGTLVMMFDWEQPTVSVYLTATLESYNFGGGNFGESYFYVSTDGIAYTKIVDNPTTPNLNSFKYYNGFLPEEFLGTTELYFKVELKQTSYPGSYAYSQFSRKGSPNDPFVLEVTTVPEPSTAILGTLSLLSYLCRRRLIKKH